MGKHILSKIFVIFISVSCIFLTFRCSDDDSGSGSAVNNAPIADDITINCIMDAQASIKLTASDLDGNDLIWYIDTNPSHGSLVGTAPDLTFTPESGYLGSDSFTFHVNDGMVDSNTATVSISIQSNSGMLDATFGTDGIVVHNNAAGGNSNDIAIAMTRDSIGRILVVGDSTNLSGNYDMVIWRYTINGNLDITFGTGGIVVYNNAAGGDGIDRGWAITTDSEGRILVAGDSVNSSGNSDMVIWRYDDSGNLDTTFNTKGYVVHNSAAGGNSHDLGKAIATDSNGKILVAGYSVNSSVNSDMIIWRYDDSGILDTTFGSGGITVHNNAAGGNDDDYGIAVVLDSDEKILVAGYSVNASDNDDMVIWRYNTNGSIDTTFNSKGYVAHNNAAGGNSKDRGNAITIDSDENILVTGQSMNLSGNDDMVIWRYTSSGSLDTTFGASSIGIVAHDNAAGGSGDDHGNAIIMDSNGRILVAGYSASTLYTVITIWRYNADGSLDTGFGGNGYVHNSISGGYSAGNAIVTDSNERILVAGTGNNGTNFDMAIWRYNP